jgi:iron complex transport system ATP-binding protein
MILAAEDLAIGYRGRRVAERLSFSLGAGEVLCLLGPNGCGKTTLFKTLLGLVPARGGRILVDGEVVARWSRRRLAKAMGYVPQTHTGYFPFTVREVVLMGRTARKSPFATPSRVDHAAAERALSELGLLDFAERIYTEFSGGERQLALIARALAREPRLLVLDEPTASLDFGNQVRVLAKVKALAAAGIAVLMSTHNPDHALQSARRVALTHDGRLVALGRPEEEITAASMRLLYGVDVEVVSLPGRPPICAPRS